jgi:membrane-associated phospholipid phosphatase
MPKLCSATILFLFFMTGVLGQNADSAGQLNTVVRRPYIIRKWLDIPLTAAMAGWTFYSFAQISKKDGTSAEKLTTLSRSDVNGFDRWGIRRYNRNVDKASYYPFYAAVPYPPVFMFLDKKMRKDYAELLFLYTQAMSITGALYGSSAHYFPRLRPLVYDANSPMDVRQSSNSRNSFFAGHVALVATSTFFMARVFADYHPESGLKWVMYAAAVVATAGTAYMRQKAGEHFPSDIIVGTAVGTLTGLLVPALHKSKLIKNKKLSLIPYTGPASGLAFFYKL